MKARFIVYAAVGGGLYLYSMASFAVIPNVNAANPVGQCIDVATKACKDKGAEVTQDVYNTIADKCKEKFGK